MCFGGVTLYPFFSSTIMKVPKIQDKILALRLLHRDPEAFGQLYDLYVTSIYRFIYLKVSSTQDAEDLTSEVFLKIWNYVSKLDEPVGNLRALLYRTARNSVIDFYRRRSHEISAAIDEEAVLQVVDDRQQSLIDEIDAKVEMRTVEHVLRHMKDEYREVLVLYYLNGLSVAEVADALEKSKGAVRVLIHRALNTIRELLSEHER